MNLRLVVVPFPTGNTYDPQGEFTVAIYRLCDGARLTDELNEDLWNYLDGIYWMNLGGTGALSSGLPLGEAIDLSIEMSIHLNGALREGYSIPSLVDHPDYGPIR